MMRRYEPYKIFIFKMLKKQTTFSKFASDSFHLWFGSDSLTIQRRSLLGSVAAIGRYGRIGDVYWSVRDRPIRRTCHRRRGSRRMRTVFAGWGFALLSWKYRKIGFPALLFLKRPKVELCTQTQAKQKWIENL